jgi:HicB family
MTRHPRQISSFPLRIPPTMKHQATEIADREGLSLNHFISLAIAEKIIRLETTPWVGAENPHQERLRAEIDELTRKQ